MGKAEFSASQQFVAACLRRGRWQVHSTGVECSALLAAACSAVAVAEKKDHKTNILELTAFFILCEVRTKRVLAVLDQNATWLDELPGGRPRRRRRRGRAAADR